MISSSILRATQKPVLIQKEDPTVPYGPDKIVTSGRETFYLVSRCEEVPTNNQWAFIRWEVEFKNAYGQTYKTDFPMHRTILEVGTPNRLRPEPIPGLDWKPKKEVEIDEDGVEIIVARGDNKVENDKPKGKRGRPSIGMNTLKAANIFRNTVNGKIEYDAEKIEEAMDFLLQDPENEKFVEKYLEKIWEKFD